MKSGYTDKFKNTDHNRLQIDFWVGINIFIDKHMYYI